jgi:PBP1b-binding outer membrane lipoprotein LpoB
MKIFSIVCVALLLVACSDPHETKVPADVTKWSATVKPSLKKLTQEERILFSQYAIRHTDRAEMVGLIGSKMDPIPQGMTIGKAIAEQREYLAKHPANASPANEPEEKSLNGKPEPR